MSENLKTYDKLRQVPDIAKKSIGAGRLRGMTDINPMWRIKVMTETFGMCGIGWKYEITKQWLEQAVNEVKAFCNVLLYVKSDNEWSAPIPGTGGSSFVAVEKNGQYVSDEAYKMALTDALSVAMKALGVGADVYFSKDCFGTKYEEQNHAQQDAVPQDPMLQQSLIALEQCKSRNDLQDVYKHYSALSGVPAFIDKCKEIGAKFPKK